MQGSRARFSQGALFYEAGPAYRKLMLKAFDEPVRRRRGTKKKTSRPSIIGR